MRILMKLLIVGDGEVGKTALAIRYTENFFISEYKLTAGVEFRIKETDVPIDGGEIIPVKMQLWDCAGQIWFSPLRPLYYKGAKGVMLVFDVTKRKSFENMPEWIRELIPKTGDVPMIIVGNKTDLPNRNVSEKEAEIFAKENGFLYAETSARTGLSVSDAFEALARSALSVRSLSRSMVDVTV